MTIEEINEAMDRQCAVVAYTLQGAIEYEQVIGIIARPSGVKGQRIYYGQLQSKYSELNRVKPAEYPIERIYFKG